MDNKNYKYLKYKAKYLKLKGGFLKFGKLNPDLNNFDVLNQNLNKLDVLNLDLNKLDLGNLVKMPQILNEIKKLFKLDEKKEKKLLQLLKSDDMNKFLDDLVVLLRELKIPVNEVIELLLKLLDNYLIKKLLMTFGVPLELLNIGLINSLYKYLDNIEQQISNKDEEEKNIIYMSHFPQIDFNSSDSFIKYLTTWVIAHILYDIKLILEKKNNGEDQLYILKEEYLKKILEALKKLTEVQTNKDDVLNLKLLIEIIISIIPVELLIKFIDDTYFKTISIQLKNMLKSKKLLLKSELDFQGFIKSLLNNLLIGESLPNIPTIEKFFDIILKTINSVKSLDKKVELTELTEKIKEDISNQFNLS